MTFAPDSFTPFQFHDAPVSDTPLDAATFAAEQNNLATYVQAQLTKLDTYLEGLLTLRMSAGTPTVAAGPTAGNNPVALIVGTDSVGQVLIAPDAGAGVGDLVTVTFSTVFPASNVFVMITAASGDASLVDVEVDNVSTSGFSLAATSQPAGGLGGLTLTFNYLAIGTP